RFGIGRDPQSCVTETVEDVPEKERWRKRRPRRLLELDKRRTSSCGARPLDLLVERCAARERNHGHGRRRESRRRSIAARHHARGNPRPGHGFFVSGISAQLAELETPTDRIRKAEKIE